MITEEFSFFTPTTLVEALALMDEHKESVRPLAGGMSLVPLMTLGLARPEVIVSLNRVQELRSISLDNTRTHLHIGAMARHAEVVHHPYVREHFPVLATAASFIGDVQVRSRGTIGGSVAHADPAADYLPVLVALRAQVVVQGQAGERAIPTEDFMQGFMTTLLEPGELVTTIRLPVGSSVVGAGYERLARVEGTFPLAHAAVAVTEDRIVIAFGGMSNGVATSTRTLSGSADPQDLADWIDTSLRQLDGFGGLAQDPASSEYKRALLAVCGRRAVARALGRAPSPS